MVPHGLLPRIMRKGPAPLPWGETKVSKQVGLVGSDTPFSLSALFVQFRLHQFLVRSVRCQSHATEMVAQRALRADFRAPKAPREPISELRKVPETLPDNSQKHPGAQLRTRTSPNQAEVAPERAGPRFSRPPIDVLGLHLASPPWPLYSIDTPP